MLTWIAGGGMNMDATTKDDIRLVLSTLAAQSVLLRDIRAGLEPFAAVVADYVEHFGDDVLLDSDRLLGRIPRTDQPAAPAVHGGQLRALAALLARINALHPEKETSNGD